MRIPFPERVPIHLVAIFAAALFVLQQLEGTAFYFSIGCVVFILVAGLAFNAGGGLTRTAGAYVFFYSLLVVIVGVSYKAYLGEPAQSNLLDPRTDIAVYVGGICALFAAVIVSKQFSRRSGVLLHVLKDSAMYRASIGCMVFGGIGSIALSFLGEYAVRIESAFTQLNLLIPLGIIIGVTYEIRRSGGTRSINLPVLIGGLYYTAFYGIFTFSKQGLLMPIVCWAIPVCALRYRLSMQQVAACIVGLVLLFYYVVPIVQYGKRFVGETPTLSAQLDVATRLFEHPDETRRAYEEENLVPGYYNTAQGFWDRLEFVSVDDGLNNVTDQGKVFGLAPIGASLINAIPHVLLPNKPNFNFGNAYAHEVGGMPEEDVSTGISFSPTGEAYHLKRWVGVLVVAPLVWFVLFLEFDFFFGDLRSTPWGLLALAQLAHTAPEGMLSGTISFMTFGVEALIFCAFFSAWVAPYLSMLVIGPKRQLAPWSPPVRPITTLRNSLQPGTGNVPPTGQGA